ncbi:S8 family serine peptidase [Xylella fastidiosa]|nr:S8 family serine peptidase [Xylella fastidiosa]WNY22167.1 S8 family serine peptidase [Xylella fastidiosa]WNY22326.1 S8 family serine peptidase [Xylella fastidiosa]
MTNTAPAHALGLTGKGVKIGIVDSGVNRYHPTVQGNLTEIGSYLSYQDKADGLPDDIANHGTSVAQLAAGKSVKYWPGGIAPDASIFSARILESSQEAAREAAARPYYKGYEDFLGFLRKASEIENANLSMMKANVDIQNNSWSFQPWKDPSITGLFVKAYSEFVLQYGGLVVYSTGNKSQPEPHELARLPSMPTVEGAPSAADLERGWLAVAALDTFGMPNQLGAYSNKCGSAMRYCLAAPGYVVVIDPTVDGRKTGDPMPYEFIFGTSFSAPLVSGAAALVWEEYPYFSNDLVRQTLLGTATDLGAPGVDEVFGYGALNVGKAVRGPAKFDWGDVKVSFDDWHSTWFNDISGSGGLIKDGTGTLVLAGSANQYSGATQVLGGTLQVSSLGESAVSIAHSATLIGSGRFGGAVSNAGTLEIGTDGLKIQGDYTQSETGRLALNVGDQLSVAGHATLQGGELQVLGKRDYVSLNTSYSVLHADGGLTGTFSGLTWGPAVLLGEGQLHYGANDANVTLQRLDVNAAARALGIVDTVAQASARRVEQAFREIDIQQAQGRGQLSTSFMAAAAALQQSGSAQMASASLHSLSGQGHVAATASSFDVVDAGRRSLATRLGERPLGERTVTWRQSLGGSGQDGTAGGTFALSGWLLGRDTQLASGDIVGFAFGQSEASPSGSVSGLRGLDRQVQGRMYVQRSQGPLYVLGQLGFGSFQRRLDRQLQLGHWSDWASSRYRGQFFSGSVEAGYHWRRGAWALTPYVGVDQTQLKTDGFREQGGAGFGLQVQASQAIRSQLLAGVRTELGWRGVKLRGYGEWQQTLRQSGLNPQASFTATSSWTPLVASPWSSRSGGLLGLSMVWPVGMTAGEWSMGVEHFFGARKRSDSLGLRYQLSF